MNEDEFEALADELRASWGSDRERWDNIREELTGKLLCLRWDGDHRLLLEQHTSKQAALIATSYSRRQDDRIRYAVILERNPTSGRMDTKRTESS